MLEDAAVRDSKLAMPKVFFPWTWITAHKALKSVCGKGAGPKGGSHTLGLTICFPSSNLLSACLLREGKRRAASARKAG